MSDPHLFEVGELVELIPADEYGYAPVQRAHWRKHGPGPYTVEEVEPHSYGTRAHPQLVTICNGERFSGYWLQPARKRVAA